MSPREKSMAADWPRRGPVVAKRCRALFTPRLRQLTPGQQVRPRHCDFPKHSHYYCTVLYSSTAVTMTPVHRTDKYLRDLGHFSSQTPSSSSFSSSLVFCLLTTQLFPHCCRQPGCVGISDSVQNPFDLMPATHPETSRFEATALPNLSCF